MVKLSVHTATYNRAYILGQAYTSLCRQSCKDFEWIITDDGSTDNTEELVKGWIQRDNGFPIRYQKLNHVHIPRALNAGVEQANAQWFMMLDSDDSILPETVEKVLYWLDEIENEANIAGIGYARCYPDGRFMKDQSPIIDSRVGYVDASNIERKRYNLDMDMNEVYRTHLLKKYPFQRWATEQYAPEQLSFNEMAMDGWKIRRRADKLYICDYLPDGQTRDDRLVKNNPMGFAMMHNQNMQIADSVKEKLHAAMQMTALSLCSGNPQYLKESKCQWATILTFPIGAALAVRRKMQFKKMDKTDD